MKRIAIAFLALTGLGANHQTDNFVIHAQSPQIAKLVGKWAEHYRRSIAKEWLGEEMRPWTKRCPIHVTIAFGPSGGTTTFSFGTRGVIGQRMELQGSLHDVITATLPHEMAHVVLAYHFKIPVPRWVDEGVACLAEPLKAQRKFDERIRRLLKRGQSMGLRRLLTIRDYPRDLAAFFAHGFSLTAFLVERRDRATLLKFVRHAIHEGWESGLQKFYKVKSMPELERVWLAWLSDPKRLAMLHERKIICIVLPPVVLVVSEQCMNDLLGVIHEMASRTRSLTD